MSSPTTGTSTSTSTITITITSLPTSTKLTSRWLLDLQDWGTIILIGCSVLVVVWAAAQVVCVWCNFWPEMNMNQVKLRETCPKCGLFKPAAPKAAEPIVDDADERAEKTMKKLEKTLSVLNETMRELKENLKELNETLKKLGDTLGELDEITYDAEYL